MLPDGRPDRTSTSLRIIHDPALPRLSNFICQQHRRDLIEVPRWLEHPNGATGICQVTVMASTPDQPRVRDRMARLYGEDALAPVEGGFSARTGNGSFVVLTPQAVEMEYGSPTRAVAADAPPCCVAVHVRMPALAAVRPFLEAAAAEVREQAGRLFLESPRDYGNVSLVFDAAPIS